jgi:hypothetical protein
MGLKKSGVPHANLIEFLSVSGSCREFLMLRKMERTQEEFAKNQQLRGVGKHVSQEI